ncbi:MAG: 3-hydroxyanthranilate 3,4-dioxygenase [Flavobacteriales bacterium TMED288]|nr:3-hydroxyanthranilate 3,4-dioxygenase [Flavobacteriales bacterium]RPG52948.1 MAG: 3-hydroxyanthranilate 3,4-dioxygenase [Flavobacteriales bacterium TMED288]|tara:strand:- start:12671 stop:13192 length:522 start_codon:yes stop_codon:yes gene_type:complete
MENPFNLNKWIDENRSILKPPIGNKNLYNKAGDFIVMVVAGPNSRKDYHYNESEELFYQIEGNINILTQQNNKLVNIKVNEGDMFLLPAKIPHSPVRPKGSIGLVIEKVRTNKDKDGLIWFCENCNEKIFEEYFHLKNIEKDFNPVFKKFYNSEFLRKCKNCNFIMDIDSRFI